MVKRKKSKKSNKFFVSVRQPDKKFRVFKLTPGNSATPVRVRPRGPTKKFKTAASARKFISSKNKTARRSRPVMRIRPARRARPMRSKSKC